MKKLLIIVVALGIGVGGLLWWRSQAAADGMGFRTAPVERGNLIATIPASGVVQAEEVIDVGARVSGMIAEFGRAPRDSSKLIDYNPGVEENPVLARIDPPLYIAD